jgi:hypothetical protein
MSIIPWGSTLKEEGGEILYQDSAGSWQKATGPDGKVTAAAVKFVHRSGKHVSWAVMDAEVRRVFYRPDGALKPTWDLNDFGIWSWNMMRDGRRSVYYLHTTPGDEAATAAGTGFLLSQSHGCVHIRPVDRDDMMRKHYLKKGMEVEVKPYGQSGPP